MGKNENLPDLVHFVPLQASPVQNRLEEFSAISDITFFGNNVCSLFHYRGLVHTTPRPVWGRPSATHTR